VRCTGRCSTSRSRGKGAPLILIHGELGSSAQWEPVVPKLADGFRARPTAAVLAGDRDELIPLELSVSLYGTLPDAELAICPQMSHDGPTPERAPVFAGLIRDFV
jgi:pimeloyl-ACP methyl ester carboxylesterase